MRKIFSFMMVTLDGYHAGPNGEIDWHTVDAKFNEFAIRQLEEVDLLLFGRATYEGMASWWPTPQARESDPVISAKMNDTAKIVVSRSLDRADWSGTRLLKDDVAGELTRLKERPGKDIAIFGSSELTASLLREGLVDEVRVIVSPLLLGAGRPLFESKDGPVGLELLDATTFGNGNVLLRYRPTAPQG